MDMMKDYQTKEIGAEGAAPVEEQEFFFPKHNPPVTIKAKTREEAEEKLQELDNPKEV